MFFDGKFKQGKNVSLRGESKTEQKEDVLLKAQQVCSSRHPKTTFLWGAGGTKHLLEKIMGGRKQPQVATLRQKSERDAALFFSFSLLVEALEAIQANRRFSSSLPGADLLRSATSRLVTRENFSGRGIGLPLKSR